MEDSRRSLPGAYPSVALKGVRLPSDPLKRFQQRHESAEAHVEPAQGGGCAGGGILQCSMHISWRIPDSLRIG
jgi:hypothetical protein